MKFLLFFALLITGCGDSNHEPVNKFQIETSDNGLMWKVDTTNGKTKLGPI